MTKDYKTIYNRDLKPTEEIPRWQLILLVNETNLIDPPEGDRGHRFYTVSRPRLAMGTESGE